MKGMIPTRQVDTIYVNINATAVKEKQAKHIEARVSSLIEGINDELAKLLEREFIPLKSKNGEGVIYIPKLNGVIPDAGFEYAVCDVSESYHQPKRHYFEFCGFIGNVMNSDQLKIAFYRNSGNKTVPNALSEYLGLGKNVYGLLFKDSKYGWCKVNTIDETYSFGDISTKGPAIKSAKKVPASKKSAIIATVAEIAALSLSPLMQQKVLLCPLAVCDSKGILGLLKEFCPDGLSLKGKKTLAWLNANPGKFTLDATGNRIKSWKRLISEYPKYPDADLSLDGSDIAADYVQELLSCDEHRADIEPYDSRILTDKNRGHWELWEEDFSDNKDMLEVKLDSSPLIARNPVADVKDGIIGIDFGTTSTVVVCMDGTSEPFPLRVGVGRLFKAADPKHYENPTVLEFIDLESFLRDYHAREGRPYTKWEELTISHTAMKAMNESPSELLGAYFGDLKQWCSEKEYYVKIQDRKSAVYQLYPYLSENNSFDPIEIYAYYLGLFINNMYNGIYIDYLMSFPVTFDKELRGRLTESFSKGLKKSLPNAVLDDSSLMSRFSVAMGASEPAAYAVCALREYNIEPEEDSPVFYGVFDFGGGTTDFDFGLWKLSNENDLRHDYVIEHFGAGGDRYLGGENILRLLAYHVFSENIELCREKKITFQRPAEGKRFSGDELFVRDSQESRMNMKRCMEALRPVWERNPDRYEEIKNLGVISVELSDINGRVIPGCSMKVDVSELERIIRNRIQDGVSRFFHALKLTFKDPRLKSIDKVNIFLAGNSSLSPVVNELFENEINSLTNKLESKQAAAELFPPLGSAEAISILEGRREFMPSSPTGKTGVAFGLTYCRPGGRIKVVSNDVTDEGETKFRFYVGMPRKKRFVYTLSPGEAFGEWKKFLPADEKNVELYYTSLPDASANTLDISHTMLKRVLLKETAENAWVYISAFAPDEIAYVVATEDGIGSSVYICEPEVLSLKD